MGRLTVKGLEKLTAPGRYGDGDGLWLQLRRPDAKRKRPVLGPTRSWLFRYSWGGRQRQMGLGPYPEIGLADARDLAYAARKTILAGLDPLAERVKAAAAATGGITFKGAAALYIAANEAGWRNPKHRAQWSATLETYAYPVLGNLPVADVATGQVMDVLRPIWTLKPETASRLRGRIETVLDFAKANDWRSGENPARWRGHVENMLPPRSKVAKVEHHAALPWQQIGAFMAALAKQDGVGALALRFVILTAARTGEVIGARWLEIDAGAGMWSVPGDRMKAGRDHRVPITVSAAAILEEAAVVRSANSGAYIFPGRADGAGLSNMSLSAVLKRMGRDDLTVHGFRSTFRQWAAEATTYPRELAEAALAHTLKDKVEAAYQRGDLFVKRRELMEAWAAYCTAPAASAFTLGATRA